LGVGLASRRSSHPPNAALRKPAGRDLLLPGPALETIVNYLDPDVRRRAAADLRALAAAAGRELDPETVRSLRFRLGTVRYTSTDRLHRGVAAEMVPVYLQAADFLARRTAVFGMTRSGKSNTVKHLVSAVRTVASEVDVRIGQLLFDLRGEYASANVQDRDTEGRAASLYDAYPGDVVRYRARPTAGFEVILNNFYTQLLEGLSVIHEVIRADANTSAGDVQTFLNMSLEEPDPGDRGLHSRWEVKRAAYQALLFRVGFAPPAGLLIRFPANAQVRGDVGAWYQDAIGTPSPDPTRGLSGQEAVDWFLAARHANREQHPTRAGGGGGAAPFLRSSSGGEWLDTETSAILNMLRQQNAGGTFIRGFQVLAGAREYHSPARTQAVGDEIYGHLRSGKIVIVDLSVGPAFIRDRVSQRIATKLFNQSQAVFLEGEVPPTVVVYIEEAHNLISRDADLTDTWPMLAKEGAKFGIGLVYATQEPSSIHPNILANTENLLVTHINNDDELRQLAKYYDFADFSHSLKRATDVGFARVRTLSAKFVVPVQIDKFEPQVGAPAPTG
jgi:Helicase HerA, central domain